MRIEPLVRLLPLFLLAGCHQAGPAVDPQVAVAAQEKAAIVKTLKQVQIVINNQIAATPKGQRVDDNKLLPILDKIDTGDCPQDFRLAWLDYLTAYRNRQHHIEEAFLEGSVAVLSAGTLAAPMAAAAAKSADQAIKDDPASALQVLKRSLIVHGISAKDFR